MALVERVNAPLRGGPGPEGKELAKLFDHLVSQPLQIPPRGVKCLLLVVDALDECEKHDAGTICLYSLKKNRKSHHTKF